MLWRAAVTPKSGNGDIMISNGVGTQIMVTAPPDTGLAMEPLPSRADSAQATKEAEQTVGL